MTGIVKFALSAASALPLYFCGEAGATGTVLDGGESVRTPAAPNGLEICELGATTVGSSEFDLQYSPNTDGFCDIASIPSGAFLALDQADISAAPDDAKTNENVSLKIATSTAIPEPVTYILFGIGLLGCAQRFCGAKNK